MLTLYFLPGCPFYAKVCVARDELGLTCVEKNVQNPEFAQELMARGGKMQSPYLVDDETGTEMYESDDIITYLHERFGKKDVG